jgi:hypothetical protein
VDLTVLNQGEEPLDVTIAAEPFNRVDPALSVPEWLSLDQTTAHVDAASQAIVKVSISIPDDATPAGRYASVAITTGAPDSEGGSTSVSGRLVVPFLITVEGDLERNAEIERFAAVMELDGRLGFRTEVSNDGNIHWQSGGMAIVNKGDGSDYGTLEFEQNRIYPQSSATLATTSTLPMEPGGEYTATAELNYGVEDPVTAETEFIFTASLTVNGSACENLDRGPTMAANLVNDGDLGVITSVNMTVATADGMPIGQTGALGPDIAWPGETTAISAVLPDRLQTGDYVLVIETLTGASAEPTVVEVPFSIGGTGPNVAPLCPQPESTPDAG